MRGVAVSRKTLFWVMVANAAAPLVGVAAFMLVNGF
jgi:hypothetical protein